MDQCSPLQPESTTVVNPPDRLTAMSSAGGPAESLPRLTSHVFTLFATTGVRLGPLRWNDGLAGFYDSQVTQTLATRQRSCDFTTSR